MQDRKKPAEPGAFTGRHMLMLMLAFFGVIIAVNAFMVWQATSSWTGLVVKNSYVESQRFNDVTAKRKEQAALGWTGISEYTGGRLAFTLTDAKGRNIRDAAVEVKIGRTAHENDDQTVKMEPDSGGRHVVDMQLAGGLWQADYMVSRQNGDIWQKSYRFVVRD